MSEQTKATIEKLKEILNNVKFGDGFKPSDFSSVEECLAYIEKYKETLPVVDEKLFSLKDEEIKKADEEFKKAEWDKKCIADKESLYRSVNQTFNYILPRAIHNIQVDGKDACNMDEIMTEYDRIGRKHLVPYMCVDSFINPKAKELCHSFLWKCVEHAIKKPPYNDVIKTPYEELPLSTRANFKMRKALGLKTDENVAFLESFDDELKYLRKEVDISYLYDYYHGSKELMELPREQRLDEIENNYSNVCSNELEQIHKEQSLRVNRDNLIADKKDMQTINALCSEIVSSMEDRGKRHFKVKERTHEARVNLAKKGILPNEIVSGKTVSGVVAVDAVAEEVKENGSLDTKAQNEVFKKAKQRDYSENR